MNAGYVRDGHGGGAEAAVGFADDGLGASPPTFLAPQAKAPLSPCSNTTGSERMPLNVGVHVVWATFRDDTSRGTSSRHSYSCTEAAPAAILKKRENGNKEIFWLKIG